MNARMQSSNDGATLGDQREAVTKVETGTDGARLAASTRVS